MSSPRPDDGSATKNRTNAILASALAVIAVVAVALLGWMFLSEDSEGDTMAETSTVTQTVSPPEQDSATATNTVEQTTEQTVEDTSVATASAAPTASNTPAPDAPGTATELPADVCNTSKFEESGHDFVDVVMFCELGWARGGLAQTDYVRNFQWNNGQWDIYPAAGESPQTGYPCYDTEAMAQAGAPRVMLMEILACESSN